MSCTEAQKRSIERLDGPLLISAGAGSGKTFTLTRRIAWALTPGSKAPGEAFVKDIDEVLAITFTDKAAREIKARVRATLRQEGLQEQALKVDAAWISTIHGMCSRILREKALELGIDPAFRLVGEQEQRDLRATCIEEALGRENEILDDVHCGGLFREYGARSSGGVAEMLDRLLDISSGLSSGLDAFSFGPRVPAAVVLATDLLDAYRNVESILSAAVASSRKPSDALLGAQAGCQHAIDELDGLVSKDVTHDALTKVMEGLFLPDNRGVRDEARKEAVVCLRGVFARVLGDCNVAMAEPYARSLMGLARVVEESYRSRLKDLGAFDMDGLLRATLRAFEEHPAIAREYASRFKLVMVDEFQDTNQLQIDMVSHLAGERSRHLCTVGDSQQSIYAFRGADVAVYEEHKRLMRSDEVGALDVRLDANFRSNAAILDFAECVFSQDEVFGEGFLHLDAGRDEGRVRTPYLGEAPRIDLVCVEGLAGVVSANLTDSMGEEIARRFSKLRERGHEPRDMVLLLGSMANSARYAEILRAHGFDCVITGGSTFSSFEEVRIVVALLSSLADLNDSEALFSVLSSPLFALSADDFVDLSTRTGDDGMPKRRRLADGFARAMRDGSPSASIALAARSYADALERVGSLPPSKVVGRLIERSGWLVRLEAAGTPGMARAANVLKALRFIEDFEADGLGLAQVARSFARFVDECGKEKPGALTPEEKNFVQIMTVHASKGLEFPIVALADCWGLRDEGKGSLIAKHASGTVWCSLMPSRSLAEAGPKSLKYSLEESGRPLLERIESEGSPFVYRSLLKELACEDALAECRRRFYVAVTRASEALIAVFPSVPRGRKKPIVEDVRAALCGDLPFPDSDAMLDYGGRELAAFSRVRVSREDLAAEGSARSFGASPSAFLHPSFVDSPPSDAIPWRPLRDSVCSYSSLSAPLDRLEASGAEGSQDSSRESAVLSPWDMEEGVAWDEVFSEVTATADRAADFGRAFHLCAQASVELRSGEGVPCTLSADRIDAVCRSCGLGSEGKARLVRAFELWGSSASCRRAFAHPRLDAETPFMVDIGGILLEGSIDLLCTGLASDRAYIVDYKTGGSFSEDGDALRAKHLLQAQCYALATLRQGFRFVRLDFVRVEQAMEDGEVQVVSYEFGAEGLSELEECVRRAYGSSV